MAARIVADRYELADRLGSGGGGVVWRAHDTSLGRTVAVKEIELAHHLPEVERDRLQARALREARAAAQLQHRNVVNVYDVKSTDDAIFIIMEYVDAPSLQTLVATQGRLTPQRAAEIGLDVTAALQAAHAAGVVHRDVKPSNVLVGPAGAQVTDFGIATVTDDASLTMTGQAMGTPDFVSPEQVTDAPVGPATDVWSLGATLYHAVEGQPPFRRDSALSTVHAVVNAPPHDVRQAGPMADLLLAMLAKEPARRPTLDQVRAELRAVADGPGVADATTAIAPLAGDTVAFTAPQPVPPPPSAAPTRVSPPPPPPPATRRATRERPERSRIGMLAAVAAALLLLVVAVTLLLTNDADPPPTDVGTEPADTGTVPAETEPPETAPPSPDPTTEDATTQPEQTDPPSPSPEPTDTAPDETPTDTPTDEPAPTDDLTVTPSNWQSYQAPTGLLSG